MTTGIAIGLAIAAICGVVSLWLILRFFEHVYDRGGRKDLTAASTAVRKVYDPKWLDKLTRFLPEARQPESKDDTKQQDEIDGDEDPSAIEAA
jgi:hypothetical protein